MIRLNKRRSTRLIALAIASLATLLLVWITTPATIFPPANPANPVMVHVVQYGPHSRIVLPTNDNALIQYSFGDWNYYALNNHGIGDALAALFLPTPGALGRRWFSSEADLKQRSDRENAIVLSFEVASAKVPPLLQSLNDRFESQLNIRTDNPETGLSLVKDEQTYTILHNSNQVVVEWLKALDCRVRGFVLWANFRLHRD